MPQDWDGKTIEFENAKAGIASIETSFAAVKQTIPSLSEVRLSELFSSNARNIFNLSSASIGEGTEAELTIFSTKESTNLSKESSKSKSANSPFWDITLTGKVLGTYVKGRLSINK